MAPAARGARAGGGRGPGGGPGAGLAAEREGAGRALREVQVAMAEVKDAVGEGASAELYALQEALAGERAQVRRLEERLKVEAELRGSAEEEAAEAREEAQAAHAQIEAAEARSRKVVEQCREDRRKVSEAAEEAQAWARQEVERSKAAEEEAVRHARTSASEAIAEVRASAEEDAKHRFADNLAQAQAEAANAEAEVEDLRAELERVAVSRAEGLAEARRVAHLRDREAVMVQEQLEGIVREWKENLREEVEKTKQETIATCATQMDDLTAQVAAQREEIRELEAALEESRRSAEDCTLDAASQADGLRMELVQSKMNEEMAARKAAEVLASSLRQSAEDADIISALRARLRGVEKDLEEGRPRDSVHDQPCPACRGRGDGSSTAACGPQEFPAVDGRAAQEPAGAGTRPASPSPKLSAKTDHGKLSDATGRINTPERIRRAKSAASMVEKEGRKVPHSRVAELARRAGQEGVEGAPTPERRAVAVGGASAQNPLASGTAAPPRDVSQGRADMHSSAEHAHAGHVAKVSEARRVGGLGPSPPASRPPSGKRKAGGRSTIVSTSGHQAVQGGTAPRSAGRSRPTSTSRPSSASVKLGPYQVVNSSRPKSSLSTEEGQLPREGDAESNAQGAPSRRETVKGLPGRRVSLSSSNFAHSATFRFA